MHAKDEDYCFRVIYFSAGYSWIVRLSHLYLMRFTKAGLKLGSIMNPCANLFFKHAKHPL